MPEKNKSYAAAAVLMASVLIGVLAGASSAALIVALNLANTTREAHHWLLALLPIAGFAVGYIYWRWGQPVAGGNNLLLDEIHEPKQTVPLLMAPLVLIGTVLTHLFGGSAGREGTAVQMGGSLADFVAARFKLTGAARRVALMAGIAGGFGGVFGTPWAGAVFGMEVLAVGWVGWGSVLEGAVPCVIAAWVGDWTCKALGVHHTLYLVRESPSWDTSTWLWAVAAGVVFGLIARLFEASTHSVSKLFKSFIVWPPLRPLIGGTAVALLIWQLNAWPFAGLSVPVIVQSFAQQQPWWVWAAKLGLTALTLGAGFKGGEVTPLFLMGAASGSAMSAFMPLGTGVLAGMGFAAVFAGAANTPIAGFILGTELFGWKVGVLTGIASFVSFLFSGTGIYTSQKPMQMRWKQWLLKEKS